MPAMQREELGTLGAFRVVARRKVIKEMEAPESNCALAFC